MANGRYVVDDESFEVYPSEDEEQYWGNDDYAPPYYEELDFNKDPKTEYLPEEELEYDDNEEG